MTSVIHARWQAPSSVVALSTTRAGGFSTGPYATFNLGHHVGDDAAAVARNREKLQSLCPGLEAIQWLNQVHGTGVWPADSPQSPARADAVITGRPGLACAILTADCLPVVLSDDEGRQVAALHAGWRGLCAGVIPCTVAAFDSPAPVLSAWLGPAIGRAHFEVGPEVRERFLREMALDRAQIEACFLPSPARERHYLADLAGLARAQLHALGVAQVDGGDFCTFDDPAQFFSYRRDGITGRMATLVYKPLI